MDRGAWWARVHRVPKSRTRLSNFTTTTTNNFDNFFFKKLYKFKSLYIARRPVPLEIWDLRQCDSILISRSDKTYWKLKKWGQVVNKEKRKKARLRNSQPKLTKTFMMSYKEMAAVEVSK